VVIAGQRPASHAQARRGAQIMLGRLQQLLQTPSVKDFQVTVPVSESQADVARRTRKSIASGLAAALAAQTWSDVASASAGLAPKDSAAPSVARVSARLRETSEALKTQATTANEKATVEVVALMFQAILQEDRIPPGIRVWFARLQIPVLRLALAEPEFFGNLDHPARQLIDRMGSCAFGFDASGIHASELEAEIKRVVQVIEQYPETGKRVYELVHDEFKKFLARFLTGSSVTQKVVSVAQQIEQKETLTIQYTIEMRSLLQDIPVRDEIRDFLYKVWAEVLAVAAVAKGPQHDDTLGLKKTASDLVWAVSAKPSRADRARVIQDLPPLLQQLRAGMGLLGVGAADQEARIKVISATLADAFLSKTQAIPREQIEALAQRLSRLEDFVSEEITEDLPLDAQSIEMMIGLEDSPIDIVTDGGSEPNAETLEWAQALELGAWFTLNYHGWLARVQYMWRSERGHLNLFASSDGHSYLIQAGRLAAYLQAGLLAPQEAEALTVRATRNALDQLQAQPERLLG
jgi:type III secretion system FlhB-like substrate exporter